MRRLPTFYPFYPFPFHILSRQIINIEIIIPFIDFDLPNQHLVKHVWLKKVLK